MKARPEARWLLPEQSETGPKKRELRAGPGLAQTSSVLWQLEAKDQQGPHTAFLSGHLDTRESTMASDHQTQAGKPQPLNPKVGILLEGGAGNLYVLRSLCKVNFLLLVPSLYPVPQGTQSL